MKKRYKVLKELPFADVGDVIYKDTRQGRQYWILEQEGQEDMLCNLDGVMGDVFALYCGSKDWFEEVKEDELPKRWRAKGIEEYFYIDSEESVECIIDTNHEDYDTPRYDFGNYFKTREEAEEAAKMIKLVLMLKHSELIGNAECLYKTLEDYFKDNNWNYLRKRTERIYKQVS